MAIVDTGPIRQIALGYDDVQLLTLVPSPLVPLCVGFADGVPGPSTSFVVDSATGLQMRVVLVFKDLAALDGLIATLQDFRHAAAAHTGN